MGRDMELGGDIYTIETAHDEVHIFWTHWQNQRCRFFGSA
jgi:hypothetical protein